jgi:predicted nucleic-acid-binding Zn-ribbon protein
MMIASSAVAMNDDEKSKMIKHLEDKWNSQNCPMCGHSSWNIPSEVYEIREFHGGGLVLGPIPIVPVIPITCSNCGNTILVNSIVAGITSIVEERGDG